MTSEIVASPGDGLRIDRMPGHWLLARLGKRVLRPGGRQLTTAMLKQLSVCGADRIVEFAPGLGVTAREILRRAPLQYIGVERDAKAAIWARAQLPDGAHIEVRHGGADETGLDANSVTVVLGEAILSHSTDGQKRAMVSEAHRVLVKGGRYGIHELELVPGDMAEPQKRTIGTELSRAIHVGARPLTEAEWTALLVDAGFKVVAIERAPMRLLEPGRLIADEGLSGFFRILGNLLRSRDAQRRVLEMYRAFRKHRRNIGAIGLIAVKE